MRCRRRAISPETRLSRNCLQGRRNTFPEEALRLSRIWFKITIVFSQSLMRLAICRHSCPPEEDSDARAALNMAGERRLVERFVSGREGFYFGGECVDPLVNSFDISNPLRQRDCALST